MTSSNVDCGLKYYRLDDNNIPVKCENVQEYMRFCATKNSNIARTEFNDYLVSTIFLGLDHSWSRTPCEPVLFETMTFASDIEGLNETINRASTYNEALSNHEKAVKALTAKIFNAKKEQKWTEQTKTH